MNEIPMWKDSTVLSF